MNQVANRFTEYLIVNGIANEGKREEQIYGIEVLLGKILNYGTIILLACVNDNFIPIIFFMMTFFSLRGRTGGFHCRSSRSCYLGTIAIYFFISKIITPIILMNSFLVPGIIGISGIIIYVIAPVNHPNLEMNKDEIITCRSSSRWLALLISISIMVFFMLKIIPVSVSYMVSGMGMDAGLLIVAKILKQEVKENE